MIILRHRGRGVGKRPLKTKYARAAPNREVEVARAFQGEKKLRGALRTLPEEPESEKPSADQTHGGRLGHGAHLPVGVLDIGDLRGAAG
jgi:hypothetical protein